MYWFRWVSILFLFLSNGISAAVTMADSTVADYYYTKAKYFFIRDFEIYKKYSDSLENTLKHISYFCGNVNLLNMKGNEAWLNNKYDSALYFYQKAVDELEGTEYYNLLVKVYSNIGALQLTYNKLKEAEVVLYKARKMAIDKGVKNQLIKIDIDLANIYSQLSKYNLSLDFLNEAFEITEELKDSTHLTFLTNGRAILYLQLKQFDKSLETFRKALYYNKITKGRDISYAIYLNMGGLYNEGYNNYDSAVFYLEKAVSIAQKYGDTFAIEDAKLNYSGVLYKKGDIREAINVVRPLMESARDVIRIAATINYGLYLAEANKDSAVYFLEKGLGDATENKYWRYAENALQKLIDIDSAGGDFKRAFMLSRQLLQVHDSIFNSDFESSLARVKTEYEIEKYILKEENLKNRNEFLKANIKRETLMNHFIAALFVLSLIIIAILLYAINSRSTYRKALLVSNKELQASEKNLQKINGELKKLGEMKSTLLSIISHDLKSRVGPANQLINVLHDDYHSLTDEMRFDIIKSIKQTSDSVYLLTVNLLDWARAQFENVALEKEDVNLDVVLDAEVNNMALIAAKKKIGIKRRADNKTVKTNRNALEVIIRNLLSNALKFTYEGGEVEVEAKVYDDYFKICIRDNGVGMNKREIDRLFKAESNITYGTNKEKGSGLGLKLVKIMVDKLNGEIKVESSRGKGTTFCVVFKNKSSLSDEKRKQTT